MYKFFGFINYFTTACLLFIRPASMNHCTEKWYARPKAMFRQWK